MMHNFLVTIKHMRTIPHMECLVPGSGEMERTGEHVEEVTSKLVYRSGSYSTEDYAMDVVSAFLTRALSHDKAFVINDINAERIGHVITVE